MSQTLFDGVAAAIRDAARDGLAHDGAKSVLGGLSGTATVGLLQRLVALYADQPDVCYVEIGVFQGLSLLSVADAHRGVACFGIDNFSILDPEGRNLAIYNERAEKLKAANATLINLDFEDALDTLRDHIGDRKVAVFFVDGAHDYRSQLIALLLGKRFLHERAVVVVDDANYPDVRQSTADFLRSHDEFKMVFEAYSEGHPANLDPSTLSRAEAGWLNGIHVLVRDPDNLLPAMAPSAGAMKHLYINDWLVHRHQLAELAPQALALAQAAVAGGDEAGARAALQAGYAADQGAFDTRLADRNMYSANLPAGRFNPAFG